MSTGENFPSNSGETNSAENSGNNGWTNFPPFNPEQKSFEPSPTEVIDTLYDNYINQFAQEEYNREQGFPSLSEKDFAELKLRSDIVKNVFTQEGTKQHDEDFSYSSYFQGLRNTILNTARLKGAEEYEIDDKLGLIFIKKQGKTDAFKYRSSDISEEEMYATIGIDKNNVDEKQLYDIAETCAKIASDASGTERGLKIGLGFGTKIRSKNETMRMVEGRDFELRKEQMQKRREEYVEKYGPELKLREIISRDKLDAYESEKASYISKMNTPRLEPDGTYGVYRPDEEKIKEYDELIESEKNKLGVEQEVWDSLQFEDGETHAFDAIEELNQYIESLSTQIKDAEASHTFDSEPVVRDLKNKQSAARRLLNKIQRV